jgi:hypothetical protein
MLSRVYKNENNAHAQFNDEYAVDFLLGDYELTDGCKVVTEAPTGTIAGFDNRGRIDILLELTFKGSNKILPIIIENKVLSTENNENTEISETTEEVTEAAEENSDEEGFSQNGMPLYVDLPDAIDTKEQLRNAIIFILSTESVTSPTRLSAPLKRYYPDFKIKNYGHTKMKPLLEELGLFVF